jgi:two-component system phosphate regulon sensor histidine kinase PhoR
MKRWRSMYPVIVFVLAQLAWFGLLGLWIYWYVTNYIIITEVGKQLFPHFVLTTVNMGALVGGLILLVTISTAMSLIFGKLNQQLNVTRMYDLFIANVTHELKSPLSSIQLYLETLNAREVSDQKQTEFLSLMMRDVHRLNNLINSILEITRLEERRSIYHLRTYNAETLVRELVRQSVVQFNLPEGSIEILGKAPCLCRADRNALLVVFNNLIDNAIKYSAKPVHITISLSCTAKWIHLEFKDRGIGISQENQKEVFKKFERIYNPDAPSVKGTGLGLYWVKEIVRHHRGNVSVFSEGRNRGSTFKIELPVYQSARRGKRLPKSRKENNSNNEEMGTLENG